MTTVPATTVPATAVPVTSVPPTGVPPTTASVPATTTVPPTGVPPTTVVPHLSAACERAVRCCSLVARYTGVRGARARCAQLARARDAQCSEAIGEIANAIMQEGQRPPEVCTQPRHR